MKIKRKIPARVETIEILWCRSEFMEYEKLRKVRDRAGMKTQPKCYWCRERLIGMTGLVGIKGSNNKLICQECVPVFSQEPKVTVETTSDIS